MLKPTVHLNGTGKDDLLQQYCDAGHALRKALDALSAAAPNGRDYYPQSSTAINAALEEHGERVAALCKVYDDMQALAEYVSDY